MRWLVHATLALVTFIGTSALAAPASAAPSGQLALNSLAFATKRVDVREDTAVVALKWTVQNSDPTAADLSGSVHLRMAGDTPGSYVGQTYELDFRLGDTNYTRARYVSGTARRSTYQYDFVVPRYSKTGAAQWVVTRFVASDDNGSSLTLEGGQLARYRTVLKARTMVDSTPPNVNSFGIDPVGRQHHYAYVNGTVAHLGYALSVQDWQSGFWKGVLWLTGPGGQQIDSAFEVAGFQDGHPRCGSSTGGYLNQVNCRIEVELPAGTPSGTWQVSGLVLIDNAGNQVTVSPPATAPISVTSNETLSASDFSATPNPVNNWTQNATTRIRVDTAGAEGGISMMQVEFDQNWCEQRGTVPNVDPDGGISVEVLVFHGATECVVDGLVIVDAAGNTAVYGGRYGGPDPGLMITRISNTVPPTASMVTLTPTTLPRSQVANRAVTLAMQVTAPIAPVWTYAVYLYDTAGNLLSESGGGTGAAPDGSLELYNHLPYDIAPGTYTYGFTLFDASGLASSYGVNGQQLPDGPLQITITDD